MEMKLSRYSIDDTIQRVLFLNSQLAVVNEDIVEKLITRGTSFATALNAIAPQSTVEKSEVVGTIDKNGLGGYIKLIGPGAIYDEFGTGEEGLTNPHPLKESVSPALNPYNSGPYVSTHVNSKNGKHYWYYRPLHGQKYYKDSGYTTGIPAGLQMYNTSKYIRSEKDKIIKEEVENATRIFK